MSKISFIKRFLYVYIYCQNDSQLISAHAVFYSILLELKFLIAFLCSSGASLSQQPRARTIFQRALEASKLTWGDRHLQLILKNDLDIKEIDKDTDLFDSSGIPIWHG